MFRQKSKAGYQGSLCTGYHELSPLGDKLIRVGIQSPFSDGHKKEISRILLGIFIFDKIQLLQRIPAPTKSSRNFA